MKFQENIEWIKKYCSHCKQVTTHEQRERYQVCIVCRQIIRKRVTSVSTAE